jgi:ankyrin repeat protein
MRRKSSWKRRVTVGLTVILVPLVLYAYVVRPALVTELIDAAGAGKLDRVRRLSLFLGPNVQDDKGVTPLIAAAWGFSEDSEGVLEMLISSGAALNTTDKDGNSALMMAAKGDRLPAAKVLLEAGASPDVSNRIGATPLIAAASTGNAEMARLLLDAGADPNAGEMRSGTALIIASVNQHLDVMKLLIERGANVNARDASGKTPLIAATIGGDDTHPIALLLQSGADANLRDFEGRSAIDIAQAHRAENIVSLLRGSVETPRR